MAKKNDWLEINRRKHGLLWWLCIGWWERPTATILLINWLQQRWNY